MKFSCAVVERLYTFHTRRVLIEYPKPFHLNLIILKAEISVHLFEAVVRSLDFECQNVSGVKESSTTRLSMQFVDTNS